MNVDLSKLINRVIKVPDLKIIRPLSVIAAERLDSRKSYAREIK